MANKSNLKNNFTMHNSDLDEAIKKYDFYVNDVLKEELRRQEQHLQHANSEIVDLIQHKHVLKVISDKQTHPDGFKTQVNIGCNFFIEAAVPDTSSMLMQIGLNHYLEFTIDEANKYLDIRRKAYEKRAEVLLKNAVMTKAHIKVMLFGIGELQNEQTPSDPSQENI